MITRTCDECGKEIGHYDVYVSMKALVANYMPDPDRPIFPSEVRRFWESGSGVSTYATEMIGGQRDLCVACSPKWVNLPPKEKP